MSFNVQLTAVFLRSPLDGVTFRGALVGEGGERRAQALTASSVLTADNGYICMCR